jgi:putative restriction endonuclease
MKVGQKLWNKEELLLAINLYCKLPFGKIHSRNQDIIKLAQLIGRTPGSVAFKLVNFASFDPSLSARGIKGARNASKLDKIIWDEFYNNWEQLAFESEKLLAKYERKRIEDITPLNEEEINKLGITKEQLVKIRVNQSFFRKTILASYNSTCCITGINNPDLLICGHIRPWGIDEKNRLNPRNGIAINSLHDKAFETGLITITPDYTIKVSSILKNNRDEIIDKFFTYYDNKQIILPSKFLPDKSFLEYHYHERFRR